MASKTSGSSRRPAGSRSAGTSGRKTSSTRSSSGSASSARKRSSTKAQEKSGTLNQDLSLIALIAGMIFLFLSNFRILGPVGAFFSGIQFGLFGKMAYIFPVFVFGLVVYWMIHLYDYNIVRRTVCVVVLYLLVSVIFDLTAHYPQEMVRYSIVEIYRHCAEGRNGGGVLGGSLAYLLYSLLKMFGTVLVLMITGLICILLLSERSLQELLSDGQERTRELAMERQERRNEIRERREEQLQRRREEQRQLEREQAERRRQMELSGEYDEEEYLYDDYDPEEQPAYPEEDQPGSRSQMQAMNMRDKAHRSSGGFMEDYFRKSREKKEEKQQRRRQQEMEEQLRREEEENDRILYPDGMAAPGTELDEAAEGYETFRGPEGVYHNNMHEINPGDTWEDEPAESGAYPHPAGQELQGHLIDYSDEEEISDTAEEEYESYAEYAEDDAPETYAPSTESEKDAMQEAGPEEQTPAWSRDAYEQEPVQVENDAMPAEQAAEEYSKEAEAETDTETEAEEVSEPAPVKETASAERPAPDTRELEAIAVHREDSQSGTAAESRIGMQSDAVQAGAAGTEEKPVQTAQAPVIPPAPRRVPRRYIFPSINLLKPGENEHNQESERELQETALRLQETLRTFDVNVKITDISQGPSVTRYELQPEVGVKVSKIVGLQDDIMLALAAAGIRIEAPIPGKSAIGIEVPNKTTSVVMLRDILDTPEFRGFKSKVGFAVGKDLGGSTIVGDIAKMPHMLIAGATGSGKSVCINCIIMSILYKATPEEVKLVMIDPKIVELSVYNGIPHLLIPVVTEAKKASAALNWAVAEMEHRYRLFEEQAVRDIKGYNAKVMQLKEAGTLPDNMKYMPQIVIIVDELADLMMVAKSEVETSICRLAQLARAAGMHLIIATQRPSVDVITGLIKANMPSRIAFAVSQGVDSRTILDMYGAEKLLGKGDMLFFPQGYPKPARIQGAFVSDEEVTSVVNFIKSQNPQDPLDKAEQQELEKKISGQGTAAAGGAEETEGEDAPVPGGDEFFVDAGRFVIEKNNATIGLLQRKFRIGFNRAARIMDELCDHGVVSESEGTKPRKVLMTMAEFENYIENELS